MDSQPLAQDWQRPPSEACPLQPLTDMVRIAVSISQEVEVPDFKRRFANEDLSG